MILIWCCKLWSLWLPCSSARPLCCNANFASALPRPGGSWTFWKRAALLAPRKDQSLGRCWLPQTSWRRSWKTSGRASLSVAARPLAVREKPVHLVIGHTGTAMLESAASALRADSHGPTVPKPAGPKPAGPKPTAVHLVTLGCARNEVDSEELAARLDDGGFRLVADPLEAEAVLVNTCGFIDAAKKDSIDTLLAASDLRQAGRAKAVVAVGCLAERYGRELAESLPEADAVLGFDD